MNPSTDPEFLNQVPVLTLNLEDPTLKFKRLQRFRKFNRLRPLGLVRRRGLKAGLRVLVGDPTG